MAREESRFVIRLRGLPWSATDMEIMNFLKCDLVGGKDGIRRTYTREGRPSGEAYVELRSHDDVIKCLDKDHKSMGTRYIEVFQSSIKEMEYVLSRSGDGHTDHSHGDRIVRMRGLPYQCTKEEIAQFFAGLEIVPNGISLPLDDNGRSTGEAYVEFATQQGADGALEKHKEKIGHRYIEIFKSNRRELNEAFGEYERPYGGRGRPSPYDRPRGGRGMRGGRFRGRGGGRMNYGGGYGGGGGDFYDDYEEEEEEEEDDYSWNDGGYGSGGARYRGRGRGGGMKGYGGRNYGGGGGGGNYGNYGGGGGYGNNYAEDDEYYNEDEGGMGTQHVVHLRGLPFKATDGDISNFFSPIVPVRIHREFGRDGRVSGEADVEFASYQDAQAAMQKDGESMKHRYIELFLRGPGSNSSQRGGRGKRRGRGGGMRY